MNKHHNTPPGHITAASAAKRYHASKATIASWCKVSKKGNKDKTALLPFQQPAGAKTIKYIEIKALEELLKSRPGVSSIFSETQQPAAPLAHLTEQDSDEPTSSPEEVAVTETSELNTTPQQSLPDPLKDSAAKSATTSLDRPSKKTRLTSSQIDSIVMKRSVGDLLILRDKITSAIITQ